MRVHELIRIWRYVKEIQIRVQSKLVILDFLYCSWKPDVCHSSECASKIRPTTMLMEMKITMHNKHSLVEISISSTSILCFVAVSTRSCQFSCTCTLHSDSKKKKILLKWHAFLHHYVCMVKKSKYFRIFYNWNKPHHGPVLLLSTKTKTIKTRKTIKNLWSIIYKIIKI